MNRNLYTAIDVRADQADAWPAVVPPLTAQAAALAARRLWRFSLGYKFEGVIRITSGNRRATSFGWAGNKREIAINPSKGWREFIHDISHDLDFVANGESKHGKHHARFEAKLVREVLKRGWLNDAPPAVRIAPSLDDRRRDKLSRIEARLVSWQRKQERAKRAIAKLTKQQRYYVKAIGS